jgi:hypothetical protein
VPRRDGRAGGFPRRYVAPARGRFGARRPVKRPAKAREDHIRASNWLTVPACHSPLPRGGWMPRLFSSAAIPRSDKRLVLRLYRKPLRQSQSLPLKTCPFFWSPEWCRKHLITVHAFAMERGNSMGSWGYGEGKAGCTVLAG